MLPHHGNSAFPAVLGMCSVDHAQKRPFTSSLMRRDGDDTVGGNEDATAEQEPPSSDAASDGSDSAAPSTSSAPPSPSDKARERFEQLVAQGYTPRQAAWMSPDPKLARLPRLTRAEAGSYGRPDMVSQYVKEVTEGMKLPKSVSMYNLDAAMPEILDPKCPEYDALVAMLGEHPELSVQDAARRMGIDVVDIPALKPSDPTVTWTYRNVLVPMAAGGVHPVNSKVTCAFHLKDMQDAYGLTDEGSNYVAEICAGRYDVKTGVVTLVGDRFETREENRRELERVMQALVEEGLSKGKRSGNAGKVKGRKKAVVKAGE